MLPTVLSTVPKCLLFFIAVILSQYKIECKSSLLDVTDPETWKRLAVERFSTFEQSLYYSSLKRPKNIILFIGDGMSLSTVTGARYLKAKKMNLFGGDVQLEWENWPVASLVRTFNSDRLTTDSGSAATAFMSGVKGPDGTVGITGTVKCCECTELTEVERAKSSLMYASKAGFSTGIVTTTRVTHATPAAAYANILHRDWESVGFIVIFRLEGLFAPSNMAYQLENQDQPSLADMTEATIKILSRNPKGFLLLVEGGRIDHGHHVNQAHNNVVRIHPCSYRHRVLDEIQLNFDES
ncbi:unnamed protein product [Schistosoma intercalatum]|nr:unnamed protein product [Schistosoma intercalatum]